jgi:hypothetical protein
MLLFIVNAYEEDEGIFGRGFARINTDFFICLFLSRDKDWRAGAESAASGP